MPFAICSLILLLMKRSQRECECPHLKRVFTIVVYWRINYSLTKRTGMVSDFLFAASETVMSPRGDYARWKSLENSFTCLWCKVRVDSGSFKHIISVLIKKRFLRRQQISFEELKFYNLHEFSKVGKVKPLIVEKEPIPKCDVRYGPTLSQNW